MKQRVEMTVEETVNGAATGRQIRIERNAPRHHDEGTDILIVALRDDVPAIVFRIPEWEWRQVVQQFHTMYQAGM